MLDKGSRLKVLSGELMSRKLEEKGGRRERERRARKIKVKEEQERGKYEHEEGENKDEEVK